MYLCLWGQMEFTRRRLKIQQMRLWGCLMCMRQGGELGEVRKLMWLQSAGQAMSRTSHQAAQAVMSSSDSDVQLRQ